MEKKRGKVWSRLRAVGVWIIELPGRVEGIKTLGKWVGALGFLSVPVWKMWGALWGWLVGSWIEVLVFVATVFVSLLCVRSIWRDSRIRRLHSCPAPIGKTWVSRSTAITILRQSELTSERHDQISFWESEELLTRFAGECLDAIRGDFPEGGNVNRKALLWWMAQQDRACGVWGMPLPHGRAGEEEGG